MLGVASVQFTWSSEAGRPAGEKTLETFLAEVKAAGCDGVEALQDGLGDELAKHGLKLAGSYLNGPLHLPWSEVDSAGLIAKAKQAAALGAHYIAVNCDPKGSWSNRERKTAGELRTQGENLGRLADAVAELGLVLTMHNHANQYDLHRDDLDAVVKYGPDNVYLCLDTGWSLSSEDDPVVNATDHASRIKAVHLRNQRGSIPTEWLGEGDIDLAAVLQPLKAAGYAGWLTTELWHRDDVTRTMSLMENQRRSVKLLHELWGAA